MSQRKESLTSITGKKNSYTPPQLIQVGRTGRLHGVKGELTALFTIDPQTIAANPRFIFLEVDGLPVPFLLERIRERGNNLYLITLKGLDSMEQAEPYTQCSLWMPASYVDTDAVAFSWQHFVGFTLSDQEEHIIGTIETVNDETVNIIFTVRNKEHQQFLIPVNESLILDIKAPEQKISVHIPEGLLSL